MRGQRQPTRKTISNWVTGICSTTKRSHLTRASAKEHVKQRPGQHMREYRCTECDHWHVGHLPRAVMQGAMTATEYYVPAG